MSTHYFNTEHDGRAVQVALGWDRRLGYFHMVISRMDSLTPAEKDEEDDGFIYSNLNEADAFPGNLESYKTELSRLGIVPPHQMIDEVLADQSSNVGNKNVLHEIVEGQYRRKVMYEE